VITGEIPASEAPVQTLATTVAFVMGFGAGYGLVKSVFDTNGNVNAPGVLGNIDVLKACKL
jgi:hypothetical protein